MLMDEWWDKHPINHILIDMDNTMVDWTTAMNTELGKLIPGLTKKHVDMLPRWLAKKVFGIVYKRNPKFWYTIPIIEDNVKFIVGQLKKLSDMENPPKVHVCTKLSGIGCQDTESESKYMSSMLIEVFSGMHFDGFITVPNEDSKVKHFPEGKCLLIDDYPLNCDAATEAGHKAIQVDRVMDSSRMHYLSREFNGIFALDNF